MFGSDKKAKAKKGASLEALLRGLVKHKASDLHLKAGRPPLYRINRELFPTKLPVMNDKMVRELAYSMMSKKMRANFEKDNQVDFGYTFTGVSRFRANVFMQRNSIAVVIRTVPLGVPNLADLCLPQVVQEMSLKDRGFLLVTGATGSGKSTSLAAMVNHINQNRRAHVITVEDPIEFIHQDKLCSVTQREVGSDITDMTMALVAALRQDPDVIVVGEMRDFETIRTAITAAETGHLVISTLHTNSAVQSLDRIIDSFPAEGQSQVRIQLASSLLGIISQRLVPKADGNGLVVACEIMIKSPSIERLIIENKTDEIEGMIESSATYYKMQSMNQSLADLIREGVITKEDGIRYSDKSEDLRLKLSGMLGGGQRDAGAGALMNQAKLIDTNAGKNEFYEDEDDEVDLEIEETTDVDVRRYRRRRKRGA